MKALTAGQQEVFDLIRDHISQTGMPPTRAEIAQRLGFRSPNAAEEHLKALARKGCLKSFPAHREVSVCYRKKRTDYHLSGVSRRVNRFWRSSILKAITGRSFTVQTQRRFPAARERYVDERHRYYGWGFAGGT